ncbi:hypothetical protein N7474_008831 [Penicillium riverlandense]|uniref:uncharacterized protein n=1 Tax=Penicillium riverlandense TaxID=1903569 RepID=UPI002548720F|nr:uncharacterized protein N7474_008831 [Penicillium riverlandense]KAJ5812530.1 hypothetical protein N7474_008831 [Penicillium riverlandense]
MRWNVIYALGLIQLALASRVRKRDTVTAQVNFGNNTGTPQHLASGLLYGVPDTLNQIPVRPFHSFAMCCVANSVLDLQSQFYETIGYNYERAGGAQVAAPGRGWIWGLTEYKVRKACLPFPRSMLIYDPEPIRIGAVQL